MQNFALIGLAGFIAPRHLRAIRDTGNRLIAAVDPHDSAGVIDSFFPEARFFTEIERFDRHLEKLRRRSEDQRVHYVSICSPNYLHDAHVRLALRVHAHAICEKPLVISPWNLDQLQELEQESQRRVFTVLQLRMHPSLIALREQLAGQSGRGRAEVCLTYMTRRGRWYHISWKGSQEKSGGLAMNIGIHFFDLLMWLFGPVEHSEVHLNTSEKMAGALELERARVTWYLSVDGNDLPAGYLERGKSAFRSITIDGQEVEFSEGFTDLHTRVYEASLAGNGFGIEDARPSVTLVHQIRTGQVVTPTLARHPLLT
ncbi:MAG: Gfo/Idh/MocA family oxidoreductase [Bradymonadales bacterium]|nr:Gfo/Idh/MocA family oxidoreductase [Bradymonadales bacterium]